MTSIQQLKDRINKAYKGCGLRESLGSPLCDGGMNNYLCDECATEYNLLNEWLSDKEQSEKDIQRDEQEKSQRSSK